MKIAIIGSGVAGLIAGRRLHELGHDLTLFEKQGTIGGHVKTVKVPVELPSGETELFPVEHGVFMHDPQMIHPVMNQYIKAWEIEIRTFPLTFSYQNDKSDFSWTTKTGTSGKLRELAILFETACNSIPRHTFWKNTRYLIELRRFIHQWEDLSQNPRFRQMTIGEFLKSENYSDRFRNEWLLPQVHCWWGVTEDALDSINIQTIADPMLKVSMCPQYIFDDGWEVFMQKIAEPFADRIQLSAGVSRIIRQETSVLVSIDDGVTDEFDQVIFAIPPNVCADTIADQTSEEEQILRSFRTTETEIFLHTDARWMPENEKWATANLIQDAKGDFCTLWFGELHPQKPKLFVTWGHPLHQEIDPAKIIDTQKMLRTLPTNDYVWSCHKIHQIQGLGNVWYCGAHVDALATDDQYATPSLWHENAFRSGLNVAESVNTAIEKESLK
jgi:predicted NAD/FAD-binding protein